MKTMMKFVLTMAISISIGVAPAFAQQKVVQITNGKGDVVATSSIVGKSSPDLQLPAKVASISLPTIVLLMEGSLKNPLGADASNRAQAEDAAKTLAARFFDDLDKAGIKTSQNAEAVMDVRLYYSNTPEKYKLAAAARVLVNGKLVFVSVVVQGNDAGVKEPENFIKTAGATLAMNIVKNIVLSEPNIVTLERTE